METKLAPAYANTFMGYIKDKFLSQQHIVPLYYQRFIDDIFLIWPHPINEFQKFIGKMNKIHPTINLFMNSARKLSPSWILWGQQTLCHHTYQVYK